MLNMKESEYATLYDLETEKVQMNSESVKFKSPGLLHLQDYSWTFCKNHCIYYSRQKKEIIL